LFNGHGIRNLSGAPSLRKRSLVTGIQCMVIITNWALYDANTSQLGTSDWECKSPLLNSLETCWTLFNAFGLNLLIPVIISYYMTSHLTDKKEAMNWRYISILFLSGTVYVYLMTISPNLVVIYRNLQSDTYKILIRILLIPVLNFIGFAGVHWASKKLKLHDPSDSVYFTMIFLLISCFYSRFLQNSLSTYTATTICNIVVGLQEIFMRFTLKARGKVFAKHILGKSEAELAAMEGESGEAVNTVRASTAQLILVEMVIEYVAIPLAPLLTVLNQKNSAIVHIGYALDGSYDYYLLLFSFITSLFMELLVDTICFRVQERWFKLREIWSSLTASKKLWTRMFPNLLFGTIFAILILLYGFSRSQVYFASDICTFNSNCMPFPCTCYSPTSSTVDMVSPLTGQNVSLMLPPLFDTLCSSIHSINNGTSGSMTRDNLIKVYSMVLTKEP
jgi:hypothetical protein